MIDPVKLAKDNALWPELTPLQMPSGSEAEEVRAKWRDETRAKVQKLGQDYAAWALSHAGVDDPGPAPTPVEMPLAAPNPSDGEEKHKEFRRITDLWFDTEYLLRYLPESEVWAVANGLWKTKQSKARAESLSSRRRTLGVLRFAAYLIAAGVAGLVTTVLLAPTGLVQTVTGVLSAVVAVFAVFSTDYGFNKLEDRLARAQVLEETRLDREVEEKRLEDRRRLLAKLGLPDDTTVPKPPEA